MIRFNILYADKILLYAKIRGKSQLHLTVLSALLLI
jgi:hypothetical protein